MKKRNRGSVVIWLLIIVLVMAGEYFLLKYNYFNSDDDTVTEAAGQPPVSTEKLSHPLMGLESHQFQPADILEKVIPAVVSVQREGNNKRFPSLLPLEGIDWDYNLWGSGFIVSSDGYIITSRHVIEDAAAITVKVTGQSKIYKAEVIDEDEDNDLAVLKIEADKPLPVLELADSDDLRLGEIVMAVGNPDGDGHTVTIGCISALDRTEQIEDSFYHNLIQTDAAINQGNSGGPLLNTRGEVIGINTAIQIESWGISFAMPVNYAQEMLADIKTIGRKNIPYMGIMYKPLDEQLAADLGIKNAQGVIIEDVDSDSPAAKAKLQREDVILQLDEQRIVRSRDIPAYLKTKEVGDQVTVHFWRAGDKKTVDLTLVEKP